MFTLIYFKRTPSTLDMNFKIDMNISIDYKITRMITHSLSRLSPSEEN